MTLNPPIASLASEYGPSTTTGDPFSPLRTVVAVYGPWSSAPASTKTEACVSNHWKIWP